MSDHLYHNFPNMQFFRFHLFLRQLHLLSRGMQEGEVWTDVMGRADASPLLLMSQVEHSWLLSHPFTHFPRVSGAVTYLFSKLSLKTSHVWDCLILSEPSLPSGSVCSAQPLQAGCLQDRYRCRGDICGYSYLVLGFS